MGSRIERVAILGGGPSGATLGTFLARQGVEVALFMGPDRPEVVVGESLLPAIVLLLRELGIEDEVREYSLHKPGATFLFGGNYALSFRFCEARRPAIDYSYNTPRDRFDDSVLGAAVRAGVRVVRRTARVEVEPGSDRVRLDARSLERAGLARQPDFIADATGRRRVLAQALGIPAKSGPRRDMALQAHLEGVELVHASDVHTDRLARGWSWRIPLPGRVSVGLVMNADYLSSHGRSAEDQFDHYLRSDPICAAWSRDAKRITPVFRYTNYQLWTERGVGANWAMVGDAFGFLDPALSSGLLVGMAGAKSLARAIVKGQASARALRRYESEVHHHLECWRRVVSYYYDGRLFTLFKVGEYVRHGRLGRVINPHFEKHLPRIFTGEGTTHRYTVGLLDFLVQYGLAGNDPRQLAIW